MTKKIKLGDIVIMGKNQYTGTKVGSIGEVIGSVHSSRGLYCVRLLSHYDDHKHDGITTYHYYSESIVHVIDNVKDFCSKCGQEV